MAPVTAARTLVVTQPEVSSHAALAKRLATGVGADQQIPIDRLAQQTLAASDLIIAIGSEAFDRSLETQPDSAVLAVFITRSAYQTIIKRYDVSNRHISAIYLEQPYSRQAALIRALMPDSKRVGVILGPLVQDDRTLIEQALKQYSLQADLVDIAGTKDDPAGKLQRLFGSTDVFWAVPDSGMLNRTLAKWSLELSFRKRLPVIGYSAKYVSAGAVAAVVTPIDLLIQQIAGLCNRHVAGTDWQLPAPGYAEAFSLELNHRVMSSMGLGGTDEAELRQRIESLEVAP